MVENTPNDVEPYQDSRNEEDGAARADNLLDLNRRGVLRSLGLASSTGLVGFPGTAVATRTDISAESSLREVIIESVPQPGTQRILFTTTLLGDGYQLYVAEGVSSIDEVPDSVRQVTEAKAGVHGLSWLNESTLEYSMDGRTYHSTITKNGKRANNRVVDNEPIHFPTDDVSIQANFVYCELGWCVRIADSDYGSLYCTSHSVPPMTHGHFAVYPSGNYRGGFNLWIGMKGNCIWAGEENYTGWCTRICGPDGGLPSVSDLANVFEEAIQRAADAAGIAIPAAVVVALAYYLAVTTLAPPVGVPGI